MQHSVSLANMPPWTSHGGCLAAMRGKDCVAIATDHNPGGHQADMPDAAFKKVFKVTLRTFVGLSGLQLDILAVRDRTIKRHTESEMSKCHEMGPQQLSIVLSSLLFKQRSNPYYVESVVAGLEPDLEAGALKPYICYMDWIGCRREPQDFLAAGTCAAQLTGMFGSLWKPDLSPDDLFKILSFSLSQAFARDPTASLGASALIYLIEADNITERLVEL